MSDHDYRLLVEAAGWIERHAGVDAPAYPRLDRLSSVVNCIARRREPEISPKFVPSPTGNGKVTNLFGRR
jgi:hypothetical protein